MTLRILCYSLTLCRIYCVCKTFIFAAYSPEMIRLPRRITEKVRPFKWLRILPNFLRIPANFLRSLVCRISCESFAIVKTSYECLTITTNALPSIRIYRDAYENNKNNYAFLATFRNRFLIFATPHERPRMPTNIYECLAITLRSLRIDGELHCKPFRHTFATGETSITFETPQKRPRILTNSYECLAIICDHYEFMANCIHKPIRHIFATV